MNQRIEEAKKKRCRKELQGKGLNKTRDRDAPAAATTTTATTTTTTTTSAPLPPKKTLEKNSKQVRGIRERKGWLIFQSVERTIYLLRPFDEGRKVGMER